MSVLKIVIRLITDISGRTNLQIGQTILYITQLYSGIVQIINYNNILHLRAKRRQKRPDSSKIKKIIFSRSHELWHEDQSKSEFEYSIKGKQVIPYGVNEIIRIVSAW